MRRMSAEKTDKGSRLPASLYGNFGINHQQDPPQVRYLQNIFTPVVSSPRSVSGCKPKLHKASAHTGNASSQTLSPPDPAATGASTARGRITVLLFANKIWGRSTAQCTNKNPACFGITWSTQCKHSPAKSVCNCTPSSQFISPLCCWVPFDHITSPCLEFKSC